MALTGPGLDLLYVAEDILEEEIKPEFNISRGGFLPADLRIRLQEAVDACYAEDEFVGTFRPMDVNVSADLIRFAGLINDQEIRFAKGAPSNTLPDPILEDHYYFVVNATATEFQVSRTLGGAVLLLNDSGTGNTNQIWRTQTN